MNLHGTVRPMINGVNPDKTALLYVSTGSTPGAGATLTPTYAAPRPVMIQVQPVSKKDLAQLEQLNVQGVSRKIFMFGNAQGIVRIHQEGGDLLRFAEFRGIAPTTWLITAVNGPWDVEAGGWTEILVTLQQTAGSAPP